MNFINFNFISVIVIILILKTFSTPVDYHNHPSTLNIRFQEEINCHTPRDFARIKDLDVLIQGYQTDITNCTTQAGPGLQGCNYVCNNASFILVCNDDPTPLIQNCNTIVEVIQKTIDHCQQNQSEFVRGKYHDVENHWGIIIGGHSGVDDICPYN